MVFWPVVMSLHRFLLTLLELNMSLLSTLNWWITNGILLDNSTDSSFFLLTPLDDTPYRRMGMFYQFEEFVAPALAHKTYAETSLPARRPLPSSCVELGGTSDSVTNISA
jgi:hypothetical protein